MELHYAIEEYMASKQVQVTHDTYSWYAHHLSVFEAWCTSRGVRDLKEITPTLVHQAFAALGDKSSNTQHGYGQVVKGFLNWCSEDEEMGLGERVVKRIKLPRKVQPEIETYTDIEIKRLFQGCEKLRHPHRNRATLHLLLDTGIRASELCYDGTRPEEETGLRLENVILGKGAESYIRVMGKGRKPRTVGFGNETRLSVQRYLHRERGHSTCPYLLIAQGDEPWSVRMLQQFLTKLGDITGIEHVHAHRFRHTYAVDQLMQGTSSLVLMQLLGHTTLDATKIYTRAMTEIQARSVSKSAADRIKYGK